MNTNTLFGASPGCLLSTGILIYVRSVRIWFDLLAPCLASVVGVAPPGSYTSSCLFVFDLTFFRRPNSRIYSQASTLQFLWQGLTWRSVVSRGYLGLLILISSRCCNMDYDLNLSYAVEQ